MKLTPEDRHNLDLAETAAGQSKWAEANYYVSICLFNRLVRIDELLYEVSKK